MKRASELLLGVEVEGQQVKLSDIADQDVIVESVGFFDSELGPSAAVIINNSGEVCWFITASSILVEGFEKLMGEMPYVACFRSKKSASDRNYWTME